MHRGLTAWVTPPPQAGTPTPLGHPLLKLLSRGLHAHTCRRGGDMTAPITQATPAALKVLRVISNFNLLRLFSPGMEEARNQNHTQDKP